MAAALAGIRVADFSHVIAGPFCAMILADMGADVVKIEPLEGDASRSYMQVPELQGESTVYLHYNRNKKGVALNLANEAGRQVARDIVARSDVLVENFATGVMERLGLHYDAMQKLNPRLIYCAISGYGRSGKLASRAAFDPVVQAESGFMSLAGFPDREPLRTPIPMIDVTTGMFAAQAILAALYARNATGNGQYVEVAMFDNAYALTSFFALEYRVNGREPQRLANKSVMAAPADVFDAADRKFFMSVASERIWQKLVKTLDSPALLDPKFASNATRMQNEPALKAILQDIFARRPLAEWLETFHAAGIPAGIIRDTAEAARSMEVSERGIVSTIPHRRAGEIPNLRLPMMLEGTPLVTPRAAPMLGEHTGEVLRDLLDYDAERIAAMAQDGTILAGNAQTAR